ncbi:MAG: PaaI family thioesterase [Acidimicrobiales bacterium]
MTVPNSGGAWLRALGFEIEELTGTRVVGHLDVTEDHHTPWGVAHGGVFATIVESTGSLGASAAVLERGQFAVGTHNSTDFLRPMTEGRLDVVATPILQGRTQQLWAVEFTRADKKAIAQGRLRLQNVPLPGAPG